MRQRIRGFRVLALGCESPPEHEIGLRVIRVGRQRLLSIENSVVRPLSQQAARREFNIGSWNIFEVQRCTIELSGLSIDRFETPQLSHGAKRSGNQELACQSSGGSIARIPSGVRRKDSCPELRLSGIFL